MADRRIEELLAQLEVPAALRSTTQVREADARHVRLVARRIGRIPARRRGARLFRAAAAASLAAFVALGVWVGVLRGRGPAGHTPSALVETADGRVWVWRGADAALAAPGQELAGGDRVALEPLAASTLSIAQRTLVELTNGADLELLRVAPEGEELRLALGRGRFQVGLPRRPLRVGSPHLTVEVTGTEFTVSVERERSCVLVHAGHVTATARHAGRHASLGPNQAFSSDGRECTSLPTVEWVARGSDFAPPPPRPAVAAPDAGRWGGAAAPTATPAESTLDAQNRLLLTAVAARRAGRLADAQLTLEHLLRRYPDTPLRAAAEKELGRIADARVSASSRPAP